VKAVKATWPALLIAGHRSGVRPSAESAIFVNVFVWACASAVAASAASSVSASRTTSPASLADHV
jgi:hypothetical protein